MVEDEVENQKHCVSMGVELELYYIIRSIDEDVESDFEAKQAIKSFIQEYGKVYDKISEEEIKQIVRFKLDKMIREKNVLEEER